MKRLRRKRHLCYVWMTPSPFDVGRFGLHPSSWRFSPWPGLRPLPLPLPGLGVTGVIEVLFDVAVIKMLRAAENQVGFIDVTGLLWKDVDTPRDLEKARKLYWRILRKELTKPGDGLVSRYLNRQISSRISTALYRRRLYIDPNIISIASFLICVCGAVFLALRSLLIGGLLIQASSIIDGVDGELARLFKRVSRFGALLDSFLDRLADLSVIMGLIIALWPPRPDHRHCLYSRISKHNSGELSNPFSFKEMVLMRHRSDLFRLRVMLGSS